MDRIICYSVVLQNSARRPKLLRQIVASVRSLRAHNRSAPVHIFAYCDVAELGEVKSLPDVTVHDRGSYEERLAHSFGPGRQVLTGYPLLHKALNFDQIRRMSPRRVLLLDCDTFFFADVDILFDSYAKADCYARGYSCKRSPLGYSQDYLDEDLLGQLACSEGMPTPLPFNSGALLLNHRVWERMDFESVFVSYIWRFAVWLALNEGQESGSTIDQTLGIKNFGNSIRSLSTEEDIRRAMRFPSGNRWILDEVALWFTVFRVPGFSYQSFEKNDVLLGSEFSGRHYRQTESVLLHYYTVNFFHFLSWIQGNDLVFEND